MTEAAVAESPETTPAPETPPEAPETSPAEGQSVSEMFKYSAWVHVGPGAEDCADKDNGSCGNPLHFHAWCRIPNSFQNASIREKALAAKARKARQLRDPDADSHQVLENELDTLARQADRDEAGRKALIEEIMGGTFWRDQLQAMKELGEDEKWETIREDQERYRVLVGQPEEDRPKDEYEELVKHVEGYDSALKDKYDEISKPQRDALDGLDTAGLIDQIRDARIEVEANEDFMRTYSLWQMYIGTLKPRPAEKGLPNERVFGDVNHLQNGAAPEVIEALENTFGELEAALGSRSAVGNS